MAVGPFGPWRPADGDDLADARRRPLHGTDFDDFALLYEAAAMRGLAPRQVDECEMWELAAVLGANRPPDDGDELTADGAEELRRKWNYERIVRMDAGLDQLDHERAHG